MMDGRPAAGRTEEQREMDDSGCRGDMERIQGAEGWPFDSSWARPLVPGSGGRKRAQRRVAGTLGSENRRSGCLLAPIFSVKDKAR